jgi:hypothetical protein
LNEQEKADGEVDKWTPMLVLPNLDLRSVIECEYAAIASPQDFRVQELCNAHPSLKEFLGKFSGQFQSKCWPSLLMVRGDAPDSCRTAEAVTAFRDLVALATVPLARAQRLRFDRAQPFAYSTAFQFYPWTLDNQYENVIMTNPSSLSKHVLSRFKGQSFPEQSQTSLTDRDLDMPLLKALLAKWVIRFPLASSAWSDRVLFRSLNMQTKPRGFPLSSHQLFMTSDAASLCG